MTKIVVDKWEMKKKSLMRDELKEDLSNGFSTNGGEVILEVK